MTSAHPQPSLQILDLAACLRRQHSGHEPRVLWNGRTWIDLSIRVIAPATTSNTTSDTGHDLHAVLPILRIVATHPIAIFVRASIHHCFNQRSTNVRNNSRRLSLRTDSTVTPRTNSLSLDEPAGARALPVHRASG